MTNTHTTHTTWTVRSGALYGMDNMAEAIRSDGPYIVINMETMEIMEDGRVDEYGNAVTLPADVTAALWAMAL